MDNFDIQKGNVREKYKSLLKNFRVIKWHGIVKVLCCNR